MKRQLRWTLIILSGLLGTVWSRPAHAQPCGSADSVLIITQCSYTDSAGPGYSGNTQTMTLENHYANNFPNPIYYSNSCAVTAGLGTTLSSCSVQSADTVLWKGSKSLTLTYATGYTNGGGQIVVTVISKSPAPIDTEKVTINIYNVAFSMTNRYQNQTTALCATACFAATASVSTVPYYTYDTPRSVALAYNGDNIMPRPFVGMDVTLPHGRITPTQYWLQVKDSAGATLPFTNGDTTLHFNGDTATVRLVGQLALASTLPTGGYHFTYIITAQYSGGTQVIDTTGEFLIENERRSPIALGWTIAGLEGMDTTYSGAELVTNGDGTVENFPGGSYVPGDWSGLSGFITSGKDSGYYVRSYAYPNGWQILFNRQRQMVSSISAYGDTTKYTYNTNGSPHTIGEFQRGGWTLGYGTYGLSTITEPNTPSGGAGRVTHFTVASDSTLTSMEDPDGVFTYFGYDSHKRLSYIIDRRGDTTSYTYDTVSWKPIQVSSPSVPVDNGSGATNLRHLVSTIRPWQMVGVPETPTGSSPAPAMRDTAEAVLVDAAGDTTRFTVDMYGERLVTKDAYGLADTSYCSSGCYMADSTKNASGGINRFSYYGQTQTSRQIGNYATTHSAPNPFFQLIADSVWGGGQATVRNFVGTHGEIDSVRKGPSGYAAQSHYTFDTHGRISTAKDIRGHLISYYYDATFGNLDSVVTVGNRWTATHFDSYGRDSTTHSNTTPTRTAIYDIMNRPTSLYDGVNTNPTTISYDPLFATRVLDPKGQIYDFQVDALGRIFHAYDPADTAGRYISYRFGYNGMLTSWTNRRGQRVNYTYDRDLRLLTSSGTNVVTKTFTYDNVAARYTTAKDTVESDSVVIDSTGWVDKIVTKLGGKQFTRSYTPDSALRLASSSVSSNTSIAFISRHLGYNGTLGLLDTIQLQSLHGLTTTFAYDNLFRLTQVNFPAYLGASNIDQTDSSTSLSQQYRLDFHNSNLDNPLNLKFGFDSLSHANNLLVAIPPAYTSYSNTQYRYDGLGRLRAVANQTFPDTSLTSKCPSDTTGGFQCTVVATPTDTLAYDAVGNLNEGTVGGTSAGAAYITGNRDSTLLGVSHRFDLDGEIDTSGTHDFFWSADGLLDSVKAGTTTIHYEYNAAGQLVKKSRNGTATNYFLWDGAQLSAELDGTAANRLGEYVYTSAGADQPFAFASGATTLMGISYFNQDGVLGNVWGIFRSDSTGTEDVQQQYTYNEFGQPTISVDSLPNNRLQWKGAFYEGDSTTLYYLRARWYDPQQGRFMSEDPMGLTGGINKYAFAQDDHINGVDPSGDCGYHMNGFDTTLYNAVYETIGEDGWDNYLECTGNGVKDPWDVVTRNPDSGPDCWEVSCFTVDQSQPQVGDPDYPYFDKTTMIFNTPADTGLSSNLLMCASQVATSVSLATGLQHLFPSLNQGVPGFISDAAAGNTFSGVVDLGQSFVTGYGGGHSVFYNIGQAELAGPTLGTAGLFTKADNAITTGPMDIAMEALLGEYASGVGELKVAYDLGSFLGALDGCSGR